MIRSAAVVGTGLIGTSAGLALSRRGIEVYLLDADESAARVAAALGAGTFGPPAQPVDLAVLAVPPTRVAQVLAEQQHRALAHSYTDVASVKSATALAISHSAADRASYVGGHPLAGSERSGPLAARANLFEGRPWVLTPGTETTPAALNRTLAAVSLCGAVPVVMDPGTHDRTVALVSHMPHLVASLMAARLRGAPPEVLRLVGQGLRDTTRIAGGDPGLWSDIIRSNASAIGETLRELMKDLETVVGALRDVEMSGSKIRTDASATVGELLARGHEGWATVHGQGRATPPGRLILQIAVADVPGELGRLLLATAELGVGAEDVRVCRPDDAAGLSLRIAANPATAESIRHQLADIGWRVSVVAPARSAVGRPA